jgi:YegS/Rv2252/BmrU family lipid kinase
VTKTGLIKEEVKKNKDEFDQTLKSKADNYSLLVKSGFGQDKKEPVLIVNPGSGGGSTGKDWETLLPGIKEALGKEPHFVFTEKSRDGTTLARELIRKGYQYIVAVGGDGTINEVVNGFFIEEKGYSDSSYSSETESGGTITQQKKNRKWKWIKINKGEYYTKFPSPASMISINPEAVFGFLPCGTRNVLARSLGMPQDITASCNNLVRGNPKKIDVLTATVTSSEPNAKSSKLVTRVFLNAAEIGVGAEIIDRSKKIRTKIRSRLLSTVASIFVTLPTYESNRSEIFLNGGREKIHTEMTMAIVADGKFLGGGFKAAPRADYSDGLLDVVILKRSGSFKMLDDLANLKEGDYSTEEDIIYKQAKTVSIASKERNVTVAVEGEPIGILPATFQVLPKALAIRV